MKRNPTVVITNATSRFFYAEAHAFGTLQVLSDKLYSFTPGSPANTILASDIAATVEAFDPEIDYVLPSGSSLSTALLFVALFARGIRRIQVLMWSGNDQSYNCGTLDLAVALGGE